MEIINGKPDKIYHKIYKILLVIHQWDIFFHSKWLLSIKSTLRECDKEKVWLNPEAANSISKVVKLKLVEKDKQEWTVSPKCINYRIFKQNFEFEKYFSVCRLIWL